MVAGLRHEGRALKQELLDSDTNLTTWNNPETNSKLLQTPKPCGTPEKT